MSFRIQRIGDITVAVVEGGSKAWDSGQQALETLMSAGMEGAEIVVIYEDQLHPTFFDLRSGLAGEVFQKFSNYRSRLIIIGEWKARGTRYAELVRESNKGTTITFVRSWLELEQLLIARPSK